MTASIGKAVSADYYLKKARAQASAGYYSRPDNFEPDLYVWNATSRAKSLPTGSRVSAATVIVKTRSGKMKAKEHPSAEKFRLLCAGHDPDTRMPFTKPRENQKEVLTYDLTLSADKDFSNMAMAALANGDTETHQILTQAFIEANAETLEWMVGKAFYTRQRTAGGEIERIPGKPIIVSALQHDARPAGGKIGMPHVHVQNVITGKIEMSDGKWGALDASLLYRWKHAAGAHFRAQLRSKLEQRLGLVFSPHSTSGMITLAGMDPVVRESTSIRSKKQIEQALPSEYANFDKATRAKIRDAAVIATRKAKDMEGGRPRLEVWKEMYAELGFDHRAFLEKNRAIPRQIREAVHIDVRDMESFDPVDIANRALNGSLYDRERDENFSPTTNFTNEAFITDAEAARCVGDAFAELGIPGDQIGPALDRLVQEGAVVPRLDPKVSRQRPRVVDAAKQEVEWVDKQAPGKGLGYVSPLEIQRERELLEITKRLHADTSKNLPRDVVRQKMRALQQSDGKNADGSWRTRDEQLDGIEYLVCEGGRIRALEGTAGSGKSWSVIEATKLYAGARIISTAIAWQRTSELHQEGVTRAGWKDGDGMALAALIAKYERQKSGERSKNPLSIDSNTIIVCDEAGQVDVKTMLSLAKIADETGCRVFLTGDRMQAKAIAAGDGLDLVTRMTGFKRLDQSVRMQLKKDIAIATLLSGAESADAIQLMDQHGQLKIDKTADATTDRAVEDAFAFASANPEKSTVLLARKNSDVKGIIDKVRARLIAQGDLGEEEFTFAAQTRYGANEIAMRAGEEVRFGKRYPKLGVKNGTFGTIEKIARGKTEDFVRMTVFLHEEDRRITFDTADFQKKKNAPMKLSYGGSRRIGVKTIYDSQGATVDWAGHVIPGGAIGTGLSLAFVAHSRARLGTTLYLNEAGIKRELREAGAIGKSVGKLEVTREDMLQHVAKKFSAELRKVNALDTHAADPRELQALYVKPTHAAPRPSAADLACERQEHEFFEEKKPTRRQQRAAAKREAAARRKEERAGIKAEKERLRAERKAQRERERAERQAAKERLQAEKQAQREKARAEREALREKRRQEMAVRKAERERLSEEKRQAKEVQARERIEKLGKGQEQLDLGDANEAEFKQILIAAAQIESPKERLRFLALTAHLQKSPEIAARCAGIVVAAAQNPAEIGLERSDLEGLAEIANGKLSRAQMEFEAREIFNNSITRGTSI